MGKICSNCMVTEESTRYSRLFAFHVCDTCHFRALKERDPQCYNAYIKSRQAQEADFDPSSL